jgi:hypothetical protein
VVLKRQGSKDKGVYITLNLNEDFFSFFSFLDIISKGCVKKVRIERKGNRFWEILWSRIC